ncbi:MAG: hypothetical protein ACYSUX_00375 [Planctomycetota bacterium]|jgi:hypothetical protein
MAEENEDLNNSQSVADSQDLNNAQSVAVQDLNQSVTGQQDDVLADGTKKSEKTVKYEEFEKVNAAKKAAEEALAIEKQKLDQAIALQQQTAYNQQAVQTQQPSTTFDLAMQQLGLTADDLYDGNNMIKVQRRKAELDTQLQRQQNAYAANQQFIASHPDFNQVVGSVNPSTGQIAYSQEALLLQQKKPHLSASFQSAQGAYELVMSERKLAELEKIAAANKEHLARQGVDVKTDPLGGSAAGGSGVSDSNNQKWMPREQVAEIQRRLDNGETV